MLLQKIQGFIVQYILKLEFIKGHRSYLAGAFLILSGLSLYVNMAATGVFDQATMVKADALIGSGLAVIGGAGKLDKLIEAQKKE